MCSQFQLLRRVCPGDCPVASSVRWKWLLWNEAGPKGWREQLTVAASPHLYIVTAQVHHCDRPAGRQCIHSRPYSNHLEQKISSTDPTQCTVRGVVLAEASYGDIELGCRWDSLKCLVSEFDTFESILVKPMERHAMFAIYHSYHLFYLPAKHLVLFNA